jgi:hypothetical protein
VVLFACISGEKGWRKRKERDLADCFAAVGWIGGRVYRKREKRLGQGSAGPVYVRGR